MTVRQTDTLAPPSQIYITKSAYRLIEDETRRHVDTAQIENETGGILIGRRLEPTHPDTLLIVAATGPGAGALLDPEEFNYDVHYSQRQLEEYRVIFPHTDYIGTWHKHPAHYETFSPGDVSTAHEIFSDSSYHVQEIINPITWVKKGRFIVRYYYMSRHMAEQRREFAVLPPQSVNLIDDDDPLVRVEKERFESIPARIQEEHYQLNQKKYHVRIDREDQTFYFTIRDIHRSGRVFYVVVRPGYPDITPLLVIEQDSRKLDFDHTAMLDVWAAMGNRSIVNLIETAAAQLHQREWLGRRAARALYSWFVPPRRAKLIAGLGATGAVAAVLAGLLWFGPGVGWVSNGSLTAIGTTPMPMQTLAMPKSTSIATMLPLQVEQRLREIEAASPEEQVTLLQQMIDDGITIDASGQPISARLHAARGDYVQQLLGQHKYPEARDLAEQALNEASSDVAQQEAANWLAESYLAGGQEALDNKRLPEAEAAFKSVATIQPHPSAERLDDARQGLAAVQDESNELDKQDTIAGFWQDYDQANQANSICDGKVKAVDAISGITTLMPSVEDYPAGLYDSRTLDVSEIWAQAHLDCAKDLLVGGELSPASKEYILVQFMHGVSSKQQTDAENGANLVKRVKKLWDRVNDRLSWADAEQALLILRGLLGAQARNPQGGTVAGWLASIPAPTDTPLPDTPTPDIAPTDVPAPPSDTPTPDITETPRIEPTPTVEGQP
jgi:hypothetical protein